MSAGNTNGTHPSRLIVLISILVLAFSLCLTSQAASKKSSSKSKSSTKKTETKTAEKKPAKSSDSDASKSSNSDDSDETSPDKADKDVSSSKDDQVSSTITPQTLPDKIDSIIKDVSRSSKWGVKIMVAQTGMTLFETASDIGFIPASNRKLFTGALALTQLGPDYKFKTYLYRTGNIDAQGTINGNLVIKPSGDPTFSSSLYKGAPPDWVFRDWAKKVQAAGVHRVSGALLIDCSDWDMNDITPKGWAPRVKQDSYAPQTSPLTINENVTMVTVAPGPDGKPAQVLFTPDATGYPVTNTTVSGKSGSVSVKRSFQGPFEVSGNVSSKRAILTIPMDNPTLYAAANLRHHLAEAGITIDGSVRIITSKNTLPGWKPETLLAMVESPRLADILSYMMKKSDNHMAEQIYVAVSSIKMGKGSYTNSRQMEVQMLQKAGINPQAVQCYDGCGLSELNRVTPTAICKLLNYMLGQPSSQAYFDSMSISGRDGTLRHRMGSSKMEGRVHAKTGTINGVKTLSGYLLLGPNQTLTFSFLVNNIRGISVSGTQDRICTVLASLVL